MLIKEVCECCNLTKKAIEYYEHKGLVQPEVLENGYRDYGAREIATLKEISVLRRCGISISEIKQILDSRNRSAALEKYRYIAEVRMQRLATIQKCMDSLIHDYDIDREFDYLQHHSKDIYTIKERLVFAFPGNYGLFLSLHFGKFLQVTIDTPEKQAAYTTILEYLDNVNLYLSPGLSDFLEVFTMLQEKINTAELQAQVNDHMAQAISDTEAYLEKNQDKIEHYLAFRTSAEYKQSPAGQMYRSMLQFQKTSGYQEIFITNMKVLSKSYAEYLSQLEIANQKFVDKFPTSKNIYE